MLVHLKGKVNKGEIENTKNKSGGNGGIGFPESTAVTKFVEPTLGEKLRKMSSDILTAITQTVDAKPTKFEQKINNLPEEINKHYKTFADATNANLPKANLPKEKDDNPTNFKNIVMEAIDEKNSEKKKEEDRKKNIILFNVVESEDESIEKRKRFDHSFFDKMYNHVCDTSLPTGTCCPSPPFGKTIQQGF